MRHPLLTAAIALVLPMSALAQHTPVPDVEIMPLPAGVTSVNPAQGFIDISTNVCPLGAQEITVQFSSVPAINPDCQAKATCVYNGNEAAAVTNASSYIDAMGMPVASVNFGKTLNMPGIYNVVIPEGFWLNNDVPTQRIELNYQIFDLFRLSPAAGIQESINELIMDFPLADEVKLNNRSSIEFYRPNPEVVYGLTFHTVPNPTDGRLNRVVIDVMDSSTASLIDITTPGSYTFHCIAGAFSALIYGPNHDTDPTDYAEFKTPEILRFYEIAACPAPAIQPEAGTLEKFDTFTLDIPEVFQLMMVDDRNNMSAIYPINPNGSLDPNPICKLKAERNWDVDNQFTLKVADNRGVVIPGGIQPANGDYMLVLDSGLYSGFFNGQFVNSAPYQYHFTIYNEVVKVEDVIAADEKVTVYTLSGVRVLHEAEPAAVHALPAGIYIVNGHKTAVR